MAGPSVVQSEVQVKTPEVKTKLPENAYRELKPGEKYVPMVPPNVQVPELSARSIIFGILMNIIWSMAATFLALKAGSGIETAIPISILSITLSGVLLRMGYRRTSLLENINVLAIGSTSGIVAGGTCFTMPAIYVLKLNEHLGMGDLQLFLQICLVPFLGAILGVLFLIPFRRYFVKDMHGKLPFPEGTATNEILATGAAADGKQGMILVYSFFLAAIYNFLSTGLKLFTDKFTTGMLKIGDEKVLAFPNDFFHTLVEKVKAVFLLGTGAYYLGLGFIMGVRYAAIICAGSLLSWFVIVPLLGGFDLHSLHVLNDHPEFTGTTAEDIFKFIPRNIGIGGIFAAGVISVLKMSKVIVTALSQALGGLFKSKAAAGVRDRTEEDMSYSTMFVLAILTTLAMWLYFRFFVLADMPNPNRLTTISVLVALGVAFLFTTVSAWAIAMISTTPISGMTVTTIIITAAVLLAAGLQKGDRGMLATLLVGGVVCTALSMAGTLVTEFKLAYWLGASPRKIQWSAIIASIVASVCVTGTIMIFAKSPGYVAPSGATASTTAPASMAALEVAESAGADRPQLASTQPGPVTAKQTDILPAPQANMMATALNSFLGASGNIPWTLYGVGAVMSIILWMLGISPLAFTLGMYLPLEATTAILVGAIVAKLVERGARDEQVLKARTDKGILVASGLIAGAAILEVVVNLLGNFKRGERLLASIDLSQRFIDSGADPAWVMRTNNWVGLAAFLALCLFVYWNCRRAKPEVLK